MNVNPQLENGYLKIANEIIEALLKIRIPGECMQVLLSILRKTYGFNKKQDKISLNQFNLMTGINKPCICRAVNKLIKMNIIIKKDNNLYSFQKDYSTWKPLSKKITLSKKIMTIIKKDNPPLSKKIIITDLPKDTSTKDTSTKDSTTVILSKKTESISTELLKTFGNLYKLNLGLTYHSSFAKDIKLLKNLITCYKKDFPKPEAFIKNCMAILFEESSRVKELQKHNQWIEPYDKWLLGDLTVGLFYSKINKLANLRLKEKI